MTLTCNHGYFTADCALCQKNPGECDYGSCVEPATTRTELYNGRGRLVEIRPMCARHGA